MWPSRCINTCCDCISISWSNTILIYTFLSPSHIHWMLHTENQITQCESRGILLAQWQCKVITHKTGLFNLLHINDQLIVLVIFFHIRNKGPLAQWITCLTADQKLLGLAPGWLSLFLNCPLGTNIVFWAELKKRSRIGQCYVFVLFFPVVSVKSFSFTSSTDFIWKNVWVLMNICHKTFVRGKIHLDGTQCREILTCGNIHLIWSLNTVTKHHKD